MEERLDLKRVLAVCVLVALLVLTVMYVRTRTTQNPQKVDFGANLPTDFPADIPVEKGIQFEQSYSLNYTGQKQLTIVFSSAKTVAENYSLYSDFLTNQNWNTLNTYSTSTLSSLYGTKEGYDINVTISKDPSNTTVRSQVSISVLKKS